jgi:hypothetical protein
MGELRFESGERFFILYRPGNKSALIVMNDVLQMPND